MLLYQITNAAVQLTDVEIKKALRELDCSKEDLIKIEQAIIAYQLNGSHLMLKKRHAVLLILDEVRYKLHICFPKYHCYWLPFFHSI